MNKFYDDPGFWVVFIVFCVVVLAVVKSFVSYKQHPVRHSTRSRKKKNEPDVYPGPDGFYYVQYPGMQPSLISIEHAVKAGLLKKEPDKPHRSAFGVRLS